jgi:hypothetical protein
MGRVILTFKKAAESALSKMQMGVNGKGLGEICRSFTLLRIELRDSAFSKREGYICSRTTGDWTENSMAVLFV